MKRILIGFVVLGVFALAIVATGQTINHFWPQEDFSMACAYGMFAWLGFWTLIIISWAVGGLFVQED
jgi:hypothetical protein